MKDHGIGEWKFGFLKFEFFRETRNHQRKQKLPIIPLPQVVYNVTVRLNVPLLDTLASHSNVTKASKIVWTYQCLGSVPIEQVTDTDSKISPADADFCSVLCHVHLIPGQSSDTNGPSFIRTVMQKSCILLTIARPIQKLHTNHGCRKSNSYCTMF